MDGMAKTEYLNGAKEREREREREKINEKAEDEKFDR